MGWFDTPLALSAYTPCLHFAPWHSLHMPPHPPSSPHTPRTPSISYLHSSPISSLSCTHLMPTHTPTHHPPLSPHAFPTHLLPSSSHCRRHVTVPHYNCIILTLPVCAVCIHASEQAGKNWQTRQNLPGSLGHGSIPASYIRATLPVWGHHRRRKEGEEEGLTHGAGCFVLFLYNTGWTGHSFLPISTTFEFWVDTWARACGRRLRKDAADLSLLPRDISNSANLSLL